MAMFSFLKRVPWWAYLASVCIFYLVTHFWALTKMPVFADEAIYIRWAQLIIDDWRRYLFFPLNDGKTPVFVWLLIPFLKSLEDQLLAGRILAVFIGFIQLWVMRAVIKNLGGGRKAQIIGMVLTSVLPFWFLYHRMALMDGLLTLFISIAFLAIIKLSLHIEVRKNRFFVDTHLSIFVLTAGLGFGLAILTKLPGLFFGPVFAFAAIFPFVTKKFQLSLPKIFWLGLAGFLGCAIFFSLKLNPAFGQLFLRGENFTYSVSELLGGEWRSSVRNISRFSGWFTAYLTPAVFLLPFVGLLDRKLSKKLFFLIVSAVLFCAPFVILGKTVYPRYLLPVSLFFTVAASLVCEKWLEYTKATSYIAVALLTLTMSWSLYNMVASWYLLDKVPFVAIDVEQYQTEWSAGYGIREAVEFIQGQAEEGRVVVATEGYFGTLPDGILLYLHNQDVTNIEVFGIGQPIRSLPDEFLTKASTANTAYIMVNSHRMKLQDSRLSKVASYPRPFGAPSFDIYEFRQQ